MLQLDAFALSMGGYVSGWAVHSSIKAIEKRTRRSRRAEGQLAVLRALVITCDQVSEAAPCDSDWYRWTL
eukprot:CAMPEP_0119183488 /NCGR_PEP_ID=MMETSP1315-20130426/64297_1 /TAXON_ID=676789 /ORGANISM="Prasinoderma singularis, Strain RCC927" /LENGTH=69 /DNA_ID=CAMNT_0007177869 /DNA_START=6 /DNA_END=212 /DNA_ORIENTATION=+